MVGVVFGVRCLHPIGTRVCGVLPVDDSMLPVGRATAQLHCSMRAKPDHGTLQIGPRRAIAATATATASGKQRPLSTRG